MTREEFRDDIQDWEDLITFCKDNDLDDSVEDIVTNEEVEDIVRNMLNRSGWESLIDFLSNINSARDDYYRIDGCGNLEPLYGSDFEELKDEVEEKYEDTVGFDEDNEYEDGCPLEI